MNGFQKAFFIGNSPLGEAGRPLLISETACAHEGAVDEAKRLVDASVEAGADIIQLQVFRAAEQVPPKHKMRALLEKLEMSFEEWDEIFEHADSSGKPVMVFAYDPPSLDYSVNKNIVAIKLNSADLQYHQMLKGCGESNLPIFLGTGASSMDEVRSALSVIGESGGSKVILMHGIQDFPTAIADARLNRIKLLRDIFGLPTGYGDHTDAALQIAPQIDLMALGLGAVALEKHITMDRSRKGIDHEAALEPVEWKEYANQIREAAAGMAHECPVELTETDLRYRKFQKKYAHARRNLRIGEMIAAEDLRYFRSEEEGGLSSIEAKAILGSTLRKDVGEGSLVVLSDFDYA